MVHSRLFKGLSNPLDARIPSEEDDGRWQSPISEIKDVEWKVFIRLVEFAYTGDYAESLTAASNKPKIGGEDDTKEPDDRKPSVQTEQRQNVKSVIKESAPEDPFDPPEPPPQPPPQSPPEPNEDFWMGKKSKKIKREVLVYQDQPMGQLL